MTREKAKGIGCLGVMIAFIVFIVWLMVKDLDLSMAIFVITTITIIIIVYIAVTYFKIKKENNFIDFTKLNNITVSKRYDFMNKSLIIDQQNKSIYFFTVTNPPSYIKYNFSDVLECEILKGNEVLSEVYFDVNKHIISSLAVRIVLSDISDSMLLLPIIDKPTLIEKCKNEINLANEIYSTMQSIITSNKKDTKNKTEQNHQNIEDGLNKKCPYCANIIKAEAILCQYCHQKLD